MHTSFEDAYESSSEKKKKKKKLNKLKTNRARLFMLRLYGPINPRGHVKRGQFT